MLDFRPKSGVSAIVLDNAQSLQNGPGQGKAFPRLLKKTDVRGNGRRPGVAMQLLVTDPTATHALRKSLLDCNTLVLSACGIEDDLLRRAPC